MKEQFDVYQDIKERTGGDMYIEDFEGVVKLAQRNAVEYCVYTDLVVEERTNQRIFFEKLVLYS